MPARTFEAGKLSFYWSDMRRSGGMPVAYTGIDGSIYRSLQTGIWGVQIGAFFLGAIRGHRDPGHDRRAIPDPHPPDPPKVNERLEER